MELQTKPQSKAIALELVKYYFEILKETGNLINSQYELLEKQLALAKAFSSKKNNTVTQFNLEEKQLDIELHNTKINNNISSMKEIIIDNFEILIKDFVNLSFKSDNSGTEFATHIESITKLLDRLDETDNVYGGLSTMIKEMEKD